MGPGVRWKNCPIEATKRRGIEATGQTVVKLAGIIIFVGLLIVAVGVDIVTWIDKHRG